jgi:hypothetical protein
MNCYELFTSYEPDELFYNLRISCPVLLIINIMYGFAKSNTSHDSRIDALNRVLSIEQLSFSLVHMIRNTPEPLIFHHLLER